MRKFVGRAKELDELERQYASGESSLIIIYGRRRIGKTALIAEFLKKHSDSLYFLATEESETQNLNYFKAQVAEFAGNGLLKAAAVDWYAVFKILAECKTKTKKIIVFDEFQYIGQSNAAFPSIMQKIWDTLLKNANIMLILCGSLVSLMKSQTLDYSSPLYGRRTGQIKLKQIPFSHYRDFFEGRENDELLPFYAVTGGVPKYIETFLNYENIFDAIEKNVLNPQSFLYEEPYFLLQKEVSEIGSYFSLIRAIAMGNRKLSDIARNLGLKQTGLTKYLKVLMDLDLIEREVPVTEIAPEKSKKGLYHITDNFIAFWFKFVYPYRAYLEKGETAFVMSQIKKGFAQNYAAFVYEDVCRAKMWQFSAADFWSFHLEKVGRYWGSEAGEVDIVGIDVGGDNIVLGECKYTISPKGLSVLRALQEKTEAMLKLTGAQNAQYILFSTAGFTQELVDVAERSANVKLIKRL